MINFTPLSGYSAPFNPVSNITPFTVRDGATYLIILTALRRYVEGTLVDFINENFTELGAGFETEVNQLITTINNAMEAQAQAVNDDLADQSAANAAALLEQSAANQEAIDALTLYVNEQVALIINSAVEVTEDIVVDLINDIASEVRVTLDGTYAAKSIETIVTSGRLTEAALDAEYITTNAQVEAFVTGAGVTKTALDAAYITTNAQVAAIISAVGASKTALDAAYITTNAQVAAFVTGAGATKTALDTAYNPHNLRGTYAARPAATAVPVGSIYYATNVPEMYYSDGATWSVVGSGGNELASASVLGTQTTTSTSAVDIPGVTCTFVVGERPIIVRFNGSVNNGTLGAVTVIYIVINGVTVTQGAYTPYAAAKDIHLEIDARKSGLTPGNTYTAKAQFAVGSGTANVGNAFATTLLEVITL